jgi:dGTP triphosphohydrolase
VQPLAPGAAVLAAASSPAAAARRRLGDGSGLAGGGGGGRAVRDARLRAVLSAQRLAPGAVDAIVGRAKNHDYQVACRMHFEARFPGAPRDRLLRELVRGQIGRMVNDVIGETQRRLAESGVQSADDVRSAGRALCGFSAAMAAEERTLKAFMYKTLYLHPEQVETADRARAVIARLFDAYRAAPKHLPDSWRAGLSESEPARSRHIADFVAGMTDRYAMDCHARLFGERPEGLSNV